MMKSSLKSIKTQQKTKPKKTTENKYNHIEDICATNTLKKYISYEEHNFSDSSLELFDLINPRLKNKSNINCNVKKQIDFTNGSDTNLKHLKPNHKYTNNITVSSVLNISSSSTESFKSTKSSLSKLNDINNDNQDLFNLSSKVIQNLNLNDNLSVFERNHSFDEYNDENSSPNHVQEKLPECQTNYTTPKNKLFQTNHLSESAKLLDRIYGEEWRHIDGIIKSSKKKSDELFGNYNEWCKENLLNGSYNENSLSPKMSTINNKDNIKNEITDTSIILESLSQQSTNNLHNRNPKTKSKTFKKDTGVNKNNTNLDHHSKIKIKSNFEPKLSFLSSLSCFTGTIKCDPEAEKYKLKFKKNKDDLVTLLFKLFNEKVFDNKLPDDMNFKWNARLRSTAGACFNRRSVKINKNLDCERVSRIELSSKIIDNAERLRDTLIHELCHAACWIFDGISEGHGPSWKKWANKAMQTFPELPVIKRCHSYAIQTKFTYKCIKCGYSFGRHSKSLNLERKRCGYCYGEFKLIINKINHNPTASNDLPVVYTDPLKELYNLDDAQHKPKLPRKPSKFALFVKENYGRVKRENPLLKHGEIMKLLGSQFSTTKILTPDELFDKLLDN